MALVPMFAALLKQHDSGAGNFIEFELPYTEVPSQPPPPKTPEQMSKYNVKIIVRIHDEQRRVVYEGGHEIQKGMLNEINPDSPQLVSDVIVLLISYMHVR